MHVSRRLSPERRDDRYAEERRQGEQIVADDLERVWGWSGPAGTIRAQRRADFLISAAGLAPSVRTLELGAGTGEFTRRLVESGCELIAVELRGDRGTLPRARRRSR